MNVAILLAAGRSRRFAGGNKLLARLSGRPLVRHALDRALAAPVARTIVVVGHDGARVARAVRYPRVTIVFARRHREGASAGVRAAMSALWPIERRLFVFLGDMPLVDRGLPARLLRSLQPADAAVRPCGRDGPGHPVLLRRPSAGAVATLSGDRGMGPLLADGTRRIAVGRGRLPDVDTRGDLARIAARSRGRSSPVSRTKRRKTG